MVVIKTKTPTKELQPYMLQDYHKRRESVPFLNWVNKWKNILRKTTQFFKNRRKRRSSSIAQKFRSLLEWPAMAKNVTKHSTTTAAMIFLKDFLLE